MGRGGDGVGGVRMYRKVLRERGREREKRERESEGGKEGEKERARASTRERGRAQAYVPRSGLPRKGDGKERDRGKESKRI